MGPILRGKRRSVGPPEYFVSDVNSLSVLEGPKYLALTHGISGAVLVGVVNLVMHVPAQQILLAFVAQEPDTRRVAKSALAFQIDPVDCLRRGLQQQTELMLPGFQIFGAQLHELFQALTALFDLQLPAMIQAKVPGQYDGQ